MTTCRLAATLTLLALLAACGEGLRVGLPAAATDEPTGLIPSGGTTASPATPAEAPPQATDEWHGTIRARLAAPSGGDIAFTIEAQAALRRVAGSGPARYAVDGVQTVAVQWLRCSADIDPPAQPLPPGALVVDERAAPPRYTLDVGTLWDATVTGRCANGTARVPMRVPGRLLASGTLSADGRRIEGERRDGNLLWQWSIARRP